MFDIIMKMMIAFLCSVGLCSLIGWILSYYSLKNNNCMKDISVVILTKGKCQAAEYVIRSLIGATVNITTEHGTPNILVIDDGLDEEACEVCSLLEWDYDMVKVCTKEQALKILKEKYIKVDITP